MLFTAIVPMLTKVCANGGEAVALFDAVVDDDVDDSVVGVGDNVMDNLTQLPLAVTPVVSSESSPVCLCNQAFFRCRGAPKATYFEF